MNEFKEIPACKKSLSKRKLVHGVGVNDATYMVQPLVNNKATTCPYYQKWKKMLERCHCENYRNRFPTYDGCAVCPEWILFSNFRLWMKSQDWQGKQLDKDILIQGNKYYSPLSCIFVLPSINYLLLDCGRSKGIHPRGVYFSVTRGKFKAQCRDNGKRKYLGMFNTATDAHNAYKKFKYTLIRKAALMQSDARLRSALLDYIITE